MSVEYQNKMLTDIRAILNCIVRDHKKAIFQLLKSLNKVLNKKKYTVSGCNLYTYSVNKNPNT